MGTCFESEGVVVSNRVGLKGKETAMAQTGKAMAIDANGDCYIIDEQVIKQHGKKLKDESFKPMISAKAPTRAGEDWPVCSWSNSYSAYFDCHIE